MHTRKLLLGLLVQLGFRLDLVRLDTVEPPYTTRLVRVPVVRYTHVLAQVGQDGIRIGPHAKVSPLPHAALCLLLGAQLTLCRLDLALLAAHRVHVTLDDGGGDLLPGAAALEGVLVLEGCDEQDAGLDDGGVVRLDEVGGGGVLGGTGVDLKLFGPLTADVVHDILLLARRVEDRREAVLLAREPALAAVVNLGGITRGGGNVAGRVELDKGRPEEQVLDVQGGQGDEVRLLLTRGRRDGQDGMANLLDVDRLAEGRLLCIVAFEVYAGG